MLYVTLMLSLLGANSPEAGNPDTDRLWYRQPAGIWDEALPVGNGRLGAMDYGGIELQRIQFNEETLWDGYPRDRINPKAKEALPKIRKLLLDGKNKQAEALANRTMLGIPERVDSYQTFGTLEIETPNLGPGTDYRRELNLSTGIATSEFSAHGVRYKRTVYASVPGDVLVVILEVDKPGALDARVALSRARDAAVHGDGDAGLILEGQIARKHHETGEMVGLRFAARLRAYAQGGQVRLEQDRLKITGADRVVLVLAAATNYRGKDEKAATLKTVDAGVPDLEADIQEYRRLYECVHLDLGASPNAGQPTDMRLEAVKQGANDPALATLYFNYGRYLLMSCSRPGDLPANLQGVWNPYFEAPWNSDYHTNINLQMNYWPAEVTNLAECHLPLFDYMDSLVPSGTETAQRMYGARGWVVHHLSDAYGFTAPADGIWGIWPMGAAWLAQHPYEHYLFSGDQEFLRTRAYPLMKGAALFLLDYLSEDAQGRLVTNPSHSPENRFKKADGTVSMFSIGSSMDLEIVHDCFTNCIEAATILGEDEALRGELQRALDRLMPLQVSAKTGRLQEWSEDYEEPEPGHRHMSHLFGLHPGRQITRNTPELFAAARKSLEYRLAHGGGHTGWSRAWIISFWARFGDAEKAFENVQALLAKSTESNLFDSHPPFQIDGNFGGTAGIAEMLIQSHEDAIRLLPALPAEWPEGYAKGLRARGGYEIDQSWAGGQLQSAEVRATQEGMCRIRYAQPLSVREPNAATPLAAANRESDGNWLLEFPAKGQGTYQIERNDAKP